MSTITLYASKINQMPEPNLEKAISLILKI